MLWERRKLVAVIVFAATLVGIAAGIKLAEQEALMRQNEARNAELATQTDVREPIVPDETFKPKDDYFDGKKPATTPAKAPSDGITAEAYIVGDLKTGKIYLEKNADKVLAFASMSKLLTTLVAQRLYAPTTTIEITELETQVPADASNLQAGEKFTLKELLYPLLLNSSNVAGEAIASSTDRDEFLDLMSGYAWETGMPYSVLADPTGLSSNNSGTARGFFGLAQYLYREKQSILAITRIASTSVATTTDHGAHVFTSIHPFVNDPRFLGGKTGHTPAALDTMLTILKIKDAPVGFVVLRSQNRAKDTTLLVDKLTQTSF